MSITVELWISGRIADGVEQWWDDIDLWLAESPERRVEYPLLASVDPYGEHTFPWNALPILRDEARRVAASAPPTIARFATKLATLCGNGLEADAAELRFSGD